MVGVPAASAATTALLFLAGLFLSGVVLFLGRVRLRALSIDARLVAFGAALSLVALPWIGWRFIEDMRYTTGLDSYEQANAGPIQAYVPGYLLGDAASRLPQATTWTASVGPGAPNQIARDAFTPLTLLTLFPRVSAAPGAANWLVSWGAPPARVAKVTRVVLVHPRQGPLPPVWIARLAR